MHAKVTVADDIVFVGSFNLSRSGELNAENVLEVRDPELAERMAAFVDAVRARYPATSVPAQAIGHDLRGLVGERRDLEVRGRDAPASSSSARTQSSSPTNSRGRPGRPGGRSPRRSAPGS